MAKQKVCIHAIISGKVQGVFYRDNTQKQAAQHHLTGWVKNSANGTVELMASGERDHVMELIDWLWQGPPRAEVSNVQWQEVDYQEFDSFTIIHE